MMELTITHQIDVLHNASSTDKSARDARGRFEVSQNIVAKGPAHARSIPGLAGRGKESTPNLFCTDNRRTQ